MKRGLQFAVLLLGTSLALPAFADDTEEKPDPSLGLSPGSPEGTVLPGGVTPAFGQKPKDEQDWRFDFHGFFSMPFRVGIGKRENPGPGQSSTVLHAPPVVPDDLETFNHTGVVPLPYTQLNFTYGNSIVTGNVILLATSATSASSYFDAPTQAGINDVFLNFNLPDLAKNVHFEANVGAFSNRYGIMGEYDEGRYATPIFARTNGAGENVLAKLRLSDDWTVSVEQGIQGQNDKAPPQIIPDAWNDFADTKVGTTFVNHAHLGIGFMNFVTLGAHYMTAWSQDDRASVSALNPDGRINLYGGELRFTMGRFGHLFIGGTEVKADKAASVGRSVEILNTKGGPGLMQQYLGENSGGTGKLAIIAAQYDLSLARLLRYPEPFYGDGPDIFVSLFGIQTKVNSADSAYDNITKRKLGAMGSYSFLPWLAATVRVDLVQPNVNDSTATFKVISPAVIFRTGWQAHDQVALQYSHWIDGVNTNVQAGYPPVEDHSVVPDKDMVSLLASFWW
ncbi:MAG TPA: hypothetical protein VGM44_10895 [Polyangiaceae bacterium]|jgi:hypothetical protein